MTGVTMRAESSILELAEMFSGVAIAAAAREIADANSSLHLRSVMAPS